MTKAQIKKKLAYERKSLKEAQNYMQRTKGSPEPSCGGSADIGWYGGRIYLLEAILKEETK